MNSSRENHRRSKSKKNDLSRKMGDLCQSIQNLSQENDLSVDDVLQSSDSILGKLYHLFTSLKDRKSQLLSAIVFNEFIQKKTEGNLLIHFDEKGKNSMNFIQFVQQIEILAKDNEISKEYLYQKFLRSTFFDNNQNRNNNASNFSSINPDLLLNEYNTDFDRLHTYFIAHSKSNNYQMNCSTFIQWISQSIKLNSIGDYLQLNDIFNQGIYIPGSHTIDFHGFLHCLQRISRLFHFNLRILIKQLINWKK